MDDVIALEMRVLRPFRILTILCSISLSIPAAQALGSKAAEQAGATLFRNKGCAYCHGAAAQGTQKGPSLADIRKTMKPAKIAAQIKDGGSKMPAFGDSLSNDEVAQLVAFLRAKHRPAPAPIPGPPQTSKP